MKKQRTRKRDDKALANSCNPQASAPIIAGGSLFEAAPLAAIANHEAGHLLAALLLGLPLQHEAATIDSSGEVLGEVRLVHGKSVVNGTFNDRSTLENYVICFLAGRAADEIRKGYCLDSFMLAGNGGDLANVDAILKQIVPPILPKWTSRWKVMEWYRALLIARAYSLLRSNKEGLRALTHALLKHRTLTADQAKCIAGPLCRAEGFPMLTITAPTTAAPCENKSTSA